MAICPNAWGNATSLSEMQKIEALLTNKSVVMSTLLEPDLNSLMITSRSF